VTVAEQLASLRKEKGWSQAKLAKQTGLSPSSIAMYETNRRSPDEETLHRLARALEVDAEVLAGSSAAPHTAKTPSTPAGAGPTATGTGKAVADAGNTAAGTGKTGADPGTTAPDAGKTAAGTGKTAADAGTTAPDAGKTAADPEPGPEPNPSPAFEQGLSSLAVQNTKQMSSSNPLHQEPNQELTLHVSLDEARILLAMRMSPATYNFLLSYVNATEEERERLDRTWHVIHSFQQ
jgi:DNA-binding XRE family transcriptional regulator